MIDEKNEKPDNVTDGNANQPEPDKKPNRRSFLKTTGAAAAGLALGHFILVGGSKKALATVADCPSMAADNCYSPSDWWSDGCSTFNPDTCYENGANTGDECGSGANDSRDACYTNNPTDEYDSCDYGSVDNPDVCGTDGYMGDHCAPLYNEPDV